MTTVVAPSGLESRSPRSGTAPSWTRSPRRACRPSAVGDEAREVVRRRRCAEGGGVVGIGTGDRLQRSGHVVDRPRDRARRVLRLGDRQDARAADEADGRLEADDAGDAGGRDDLRRVGRGLEADGQRGQPRRRCRRRAGRTSRPASCRCRTAGAPGRRATSIPRAGSPSNTPFSSETFVLPRMIAPAVSRLATSFAFFGGDRLLQRDRAARGRQTRRRRSRPRAAPGCRAAGRGPCRACARCPGLAASATAPAVRTERTAWIAGPSAFEQRDAGEVRLGQAPATVKRSGRHARLQALDRLGLEREGQLRRVPDESAPGLS